MLMLSKTVIQNKLFGLKTRLMIARYNLQRRNILEIKLQGGLCNKLFCLIAACEIANENGFKVLEPEFGWHKKILFSDIYDIEFFNKSMSKFCDNNFAMIPRYIALSKKNKKMIRYDKFEQNDLWQYSEKTLEYLRSKNIIYNNSFIVYVLKSLKLKAEYQNTVNQNLNHLVSVQMRIESDWVKHSQQTAANNDEIVLIDLNQLIKMLQDFKAQDLFFTTGENQGSVQLSLEQNSIFSHYFFDKNLEYEINAAINFEILCNSQKFIGLSRSTFSNLISLKRDLILNNPENYIYNYGGKIMKRIDCGLYFKGDESVSKRPEIRIN